MNAPATLTRKLTARQLEVLVNVYCGNRYSEQRTYPKDGDSALDGPAADRPAWGSVKRYGHTSSMGGAAHRMFETLCEEGYFPANETSTGRTYYSRNILTAKALQVLKVAYPGLLDIEARLAEREAVELQEAEDAEVAAAEWERERAAKAERRGIERRERMEAVLRDYQVSHSLTPEQLEAMWLRIAEEEVGL